MKDETKRIWKTVIKAFVVLVAFIGFIWSWTVIGTAQVSRYNIEHATITGIKSMQSGGAFGEDVCIYETTKGEVSRRGSNCHLDTGDDITIYRTK